MNVQTIKVEECARILPGYSLKARAEHEPGGVFQVIMARHLTDGVYYNYHPLHELRMTPRRPMVNYRVQAGDVLFISRGVRNQAFLVESVPEHCIASGTLYILRAKANIVPGYLAWCINQETTQAEIAHIRTGAGTPLVQRKHFGEMRIPLPALALQRKIARLGRLMAQERSLQQQLLAQTEYYHKLVGTQLLGHKGI